MEALLAHSRQSADALREPCLQRLSSQGSQSSSELLSDEEYVAALTTQDATDELATIPGALDDQLRRKLSASRLFMEM